MPGSSSQGIFLSYRREDAAPYARLLQRELRDRFPDVQVFMDLDSIEAGLPFARVIRDAVGSCAVLVALIGRQWVTIADEQGRRRLDDPGDYVRFEVQAALERGVRVVPVLVDGTRPVRREELPSGLEELEGLNALELSYGRYDYDAGRLFDVIQRVLAAAGDREEAGQAKRGQAGGESAGSGGVPGVSPAERRDVTADPGWTAALEAFYASRWEEAAGRFEALQRDYPGDRRVQDRLETARRDRDLAQWSAEADAAAERADWTDAVVALERISAVDSSYRDAGGRLERARSEERRQSLVEEITALHRAHRWKAVIAAGEQLHRIASSQPDPGGMLADARRQLAEEDLADRYAQGLSLLDAGQDESAATLFAAIEQEHPGYRDATALLAAARYAQGLRAEQEPDWAGAAAHYQAVSSIQPGYRDVAARLAECARRRDVAVLQEQLRARFAAGEFQAVVDIASRLAELDQAASDPDGLASVAREQIAQQEAEREASELAERQARAKAERQAREKARRARAKAEREARQEAERQAQQETERQAQQEAEGQTQQEAGREARKLAELQARLNAERQVREEERQVRDRARQARDRAESEARDKAREARQRAAATPQSTVTPRTPELTHTLVGHKGWGDRRITEVTFSLDSRLLASCSEDKTVRLWDPVAGREIRTLTGHTERVYSVAFSPDGRLLASGGNDNVVRLWDPASGLVKRTLVGHTSGVWSVAFSPDGRLLASGGNDSTIRLWDPATGREMHSLVVDADFVMSVAFSPDGRLLASGENSVPALGLYRGKDNTLSLYMTDKRLRSASSSARIRLWDPHAGRQIRTLTSYTGQVTSVAFSPDGKTLAGGRLWDVATGQEIENSHIGFVHSVAFSPDGHLLASGDYDKKVRIWDLNPPRK